MVLRATVNCDMGEGYSLYSMGDDESLMRTIHLANVACGFHASDFMIMDKTVLLAKENGVHVGAHPSLPDRQGFGRREMAMDPLKPHGAVYGQLARSPDLARAVAGVAKTFDVAFMGLAGTCHQKAAEELGVKFIAEWFADLDYSPEGKLLITKKHDPITLKEVEERVKRMLAEGLVTTKTGTVPIGEGVREISICVHSDTPVRAIFSLGAVEIAQTVKRLVDENNKQIVLD
ncbi:hypothetical protein EW145_g4259 [Phellinidium pouzarii]|uniref:Lactam utilization protein lamB n=1 Tax=Phellinidium pouzarii TaxID=167371 RepID=A0A4S4L4E4_9AGAM|nr:hypothetical protein EW145_g4259 [Phellinidium pouzarii]